MDGLEWKRDKWNTVVKKLARYFESLGAKYADHLVADNREIARYLKDTYQKESTFIAYGAEVFDDPQEDVLLNYNVQKGHYDLLIARLEKENNIETALDGVVLSESTWPCLVVGKHATPYGEFLKQKYETSHNIRFLGGIYNLNHLNNLRYHSRFYFHGHSVGGTNPSLLEAMASNAFILAHDNAFNRDVLGTDAFFFADSNDVGTLLTDASLLLQKREAFTSANTYKITEQFNWQKIAREYESLFSSLLK
jgi:glycosyltransferase involved in cell wall biosynthesis